jgi:hypothetical protein
MRLGQNGSPSESYKTPNGISLLAFYQARGGASAILILESQAGMGLPTKALASSKSRAASDGGALLRIARFIRAFPVD